MAESFIIVLITVPNMETGQEIADELLRNKLAACVNILSPIHSIFTWHGNITNEEEALLLVKTRAELFENQLVPTIRAIHPYEVPEIIALPILMGSQPYLDWIKENTQG